jgi:argininosuccinate synthase
MQDKIVLAYSGGLDTSVAIKWLQEKYHYDVVACVLDVGEGKDLSFVQEKALKIGAVQSHIIDVQEEFARDYIAPVLQANALYEGEYPLVSALSRPLIAKKLVEIAHREKAVAVAHGCTGKGNDQVRFDVSIMALDPQLKVVAPVRDDPMSREEAIRYAEKNHIPLPIKLDNPFSIDQNLWGRSCECGVLEDPWAAPPEAAYDWTNSIADAPNQADEITINFNQGIPVAINGQSMPLHQLIISLNEMAAKQGIGRIDHVENRLVGIKSREVYEAPAAMTLIRAHRALEALTLTRDMAQFKPFIEKKFTEIVYEGLWFSPLRIALQSFLSESQKYVSGDVRVKLFKGNIIVVGRKSQHSLYQHDLATYNQDDAFDHSAAVGFIKIYGLPLAVNNKVNGVDAKA